MGRVGDWAKETLPPVLLVLFLDVAVTVAFVLLSGKSVRVGTFRPADAIPPKVAELLAIGVAVGLLECLGRGRPDASLFTFGLAFVALIAVDHFPSAFGFAQPIRPAHSLTFLVLMVSVLALAFRKRPEVPIAAAAGFFGHMAGDTGIFAPVQPFSFQYIPLAPYTGAFAVAAVVVAIAAGYTKRRRVQRAAWRY
ncbi:MAG TPA: hypothetical protein VLU99_01515 [Nitrososphaerales archaeon]|nr:hypothetical protein [Nitrososphaerales archaeon]